MAGEATDPESQSAPGDLSRLLARVQRAGRHADSVSLEAILDSLGRRSFAPFLLVAGLVTLAPLIELMRIRHCPDRFDFGPRYLDRDLPAELRLTVYPGGS